MVNVEEVRAVERKERGEKEGKEKRIREESKKKKKRWGRRKKIEQGRAKQIDIWTEWKREIGNNQLYEKRKE
jgi:hypothetical protein